MIPVIARFRRLLKAALRSRWNARPDFHFASDDKTRSPAPRHLPVNLTRRAREELEWSAKREERSRASIQFHSPLAVRDLRPQQQSAIAQVHAVNCLDPHVRVPAVPFSNQAES